MEKCFGDLKNNLDMKKDTDAFSSNGRVYFHPVYIAAHHDQRLKQVLNEARWFEVTIGRRC